MQSGQDTQISFPKIPIYSSFLISRPSYVVSLIYGDTATEEQAEEIAAYIEDNSDAEVEIHEGNQPVYSFIIGVE